MTKPRWLSPEEQSAWRNWIAVSRLLPEQLSKDLEEEHGLSLVEYEILAILSEAPDQKLRMHELARATWASRSNF
jgi:DNA-binding MarR family transcriptional regulator